MRNLLLGAALTVALFLSLNTVAKKCYRRPDPTQPNVNPCPPDGPCPIKPEPVKPRKPAPRP